MPKDEINKRLICGDKDKKDAKKICNKVVPKTSWRCPDNHEVPEELKPDFDANQKKLDRYEGRNKEKQYNLNQDDELITAEEAHKKIWQKKP